MGKKKDWDKILADAPVAAIKEWYLYHDVMSYDPRSFDLTSVEENPDLRKDLQRTILPFEQIIVPSIRAVADQIRQPIDITAHNIFVLLTWKIAEFRWRPEGIGETARHTAMAYEAARTRDTGQE
jgi:hypothetical protein